MKTALILQRMLLTYCCNLYPCHTCCWPSDHRCVSRQGCWFFDRSQFIYPSCYVISGHMRSLHDRWLYFQFPRIAIRHFKRHTGEIMFKTLVKFLGAFLPSWRDILIGCSTWCSSIIMDWLLDLGGVLQLGWFVFGVDYISSIWWCSAFSKLRSTMCSTRNRRQQSDTCSGIEIWSRVCGDLPKIPLAYEVIPWRWPMRDWLPICLTRSACRFRKLTDPPSFHE